MRSFSKAAVCICALIMTASAMSVICVSASESSRASVSAASEEGSRTENSSVRFGKVTAVNGSEITVATGNFAKNTEGDGSSEAKKEKKPSDSSADQSSTSSGSSSECSGDKSGKRKGKGGRHGSFAEDGSSLTVTVSDSVAVRKKGEAAAAADITEGDILKLVYDDGGQLTEVKIIRRSGQGSKPEGKTKKSRQTDSAADGQTSQT